MSQSAKKGN